MTKVDAYNEADVLSGGETEFKGLFQVKLDKEYWPSTEAKDKNLVDDLKPLEGVTFEILLACKNANGLLEAVKGDGEFSTCLLYTSHDRQGAARRRDVFGGAGA